MKRALLLLTTFASLNACHQGRTPAPAKTADSSAVPGTSAVDPATQMVNALRDHEVLFEREYEEPANLDERPAACGFDIRENFSYRGLLYFRARPFADMRAFGSAQDGRLVVEEGRLHARVAFSTESARLNAEINLPELSLNAVGPIVRAEWLQIQRTRIATTTSVKGAFFAPDVQLPPNLRLKAPLHDDYRIPCGFVTPNEPESQVTKFDGSYATLSAPGKVVGLSLTPDGPPVAEIIRPEGMYIGVLGMYKTTALVSIDAQSDFSTVTLVGWIHEGTLGDALGGLGFGTMGTSRHAANRSRLFCAAADIFVTVDRKLHRVVAVMREMTFWGAYAENGDFRVDLGGDQAWTVEKPPVDGPKQPLDPFIPKEYLTRCQGAR